MSIDAARLIFLYILYLLSTILKVQKKKNNDENSTEIKKKKKQKACQQGADTTAPCLKAVKKACT